MDSRFSTSTTTTRQNSGMPSTYQSPMNIAPPKPPAAKTSSTDPFLKDFTLVAEAAKRAQMAVLMRDFEGVGLS
ncbi:hypothetical protein QBC35DRAFT_448515 [Podospora australis]|uniref:Uncharacterized protein n=1 Tax=Podospora australis TaxID=1536484 RepID=A0AAN6X1L4_9PEZI|nr:hypothetical protein QBC35DRAFT_448515 [Podospora australis]